MNKRFLIICTISASIFLTGLYFVVRLFISGDFNQRVDYARDYFKNKKEHFKKPPCDEEIKEMFLKNKVAFQTLKKMAAEDKIAYLQKEFIVHTNEEGEGNYLPAAQNTGKDHSLFYLVADLFSEDDEHNILLPYFLGDYPKDPKIPRDRFFKYLALMEQCKVAQISSLEDEIEDELINDQDKGEEKKTTTHYGWQFLLYAKKEEKSTSKGKKILITKSIDWWDIDDYEVVEDTDASDKRTLKEEKDLNQLSEIEPFWYVGKQTSFESEEPESEDEESEEK